MARSLYRTFPLSVPIPDPENVSILSSLHSTIVVYWSVLDSRETGTNNCVNNYGSKLCGDLMT